MGERPDWYPLLKAARYLGVPPWEMDDTPAVWVFRALDAEWAENKAAAAIAKRG